MAYLGKTPSQAVRSRYYYTATGGETSLSGADDNSNVLTFTDGNYVDVSLNGVALVAGTDYNTTTTNTISGLTALVASDVVEVIVYDTFSVFSGNVTGDFTVGGTLTAANITNTGNLNFGDNDKAIFGAGSDLQIYHDGSNSYIWDTGTGDLKVLSNGTQISLQSPSAYYARGVDGGQFELYHNGNQKLATTATGVDVTGATVTSEGGSASAPAYAITSGALGANGMFVPAANTLAFVAGFGTERLRIDSSGNLLVGTTTGGGTIGTYNGFGALSGGTIFSSATSNRSIFARRSTDGSIIDFRKDGTTVGSIGVGNAGSYMYIGTGDTGIITNSGNDFIQPWNPSTNSTRTDTIGLGNASSRFKDLYLSGGVYLGGTGSANHLDDYEEGNWTPQFGGSSTTGTGTYSTTVGRYVKVGKKVNCWGIIVSSGTHNGTGNLQITGLPFNKENTYLSWGTETNIAYHTGFTSYGSFTNVVRLLGPVSNGNYIRFHTFGNTGDTSVPPTPANVQSGTAVYFSATYEVQ